MTTPRIISRSAWTKLAVVGCLALLCAVVAVRGFSARSALPERPEVSAFSELFEQRLAQVERRLFFPWSDQAACWRELGQLYHANRFYAEAEVCYEEALRSSDDEAAMLNYFLSDLAKEKGDLATAKGYLKACIALAPDSLPALLDLAEVAAKSGASVEVSAVYSRVLLRDADNPKALLELARVEYREGRAEEALALLLRLAARDPNYVEGISLLTQVLDTLGQKEKAAAIRADMSRRKPMPRTDPWMEELLGHCYDPQRFSFLFEDYLKAGALDKALAYLDRMEEIDPSSAVPYQFRGYGYYQVKRYAQAVPHYRKAIAMGGDPGSLYYYLSMCLFESGQLEEADKAAREGVALAPENAGLLALLSDVVLKKGGRGEALELLERALVLSPSDVAVNGKLAKLYWDSGKKAEAIEQLEMVRRLQPSDLATRLTLGGYYLERGEFEEALAVVGEAAEIENGNEDVRDLQALVWMRSGNAKARNGEFAEALDAYGRAIAVDPELEEAYLNRVKLLRHLKDFAGAGETIRLLIERKPEDSVLYVSLGDIQLAASEVEAARSSWETALSKASGDGKMQAIIRGRLESIEQ